MAKIDHAVLEIFRNQIFSRNSQCVEDEQRPERPPSRPRPHTAPTPALPLGSKTDEGPEPPPGPRPGPAHWRLRTPGGPVPTTGRSPPTPPNPTQAPVSSSVLERLRGADAGPSPYRSRISCEPVIRSRSSRRWSILHFGGWAPESPRPGVTLWRSRSLRGAGFPPAGQPRSRAFRTPACAGPRSPSSRPGRCLPGGWEPRSNLGNALHLGLAAGEDAATEGAPVGRHLGEPRGTRPGSGGGSQAPRSCAAVARRRAGGLTFLIF